ncbi:hypothetical protein PM082_023282 [Marasmius tenuissimus]|nr:hypothetical protein PM082_023282 [Marasmius tenuissimus]
MAVRVRAIALVPGPPCWTEMLLPHGLASNQTLADSGSQDVNSSSNPSTVLLNLFLSLQLISLVGLVLILATVLVSGKTTKRHPIWMNFMICWVVSCVSYSFMVGHSITWVPPHALCFVQAVMIYTVPSLTAGATLALLVHVLIFFRISFTFPEAAHTRPQPIWYILLITVPHIPALGMFLLSLGIGLKDPEL